MVKKIMRDPLFLAQKSVDATEDDKQVVTDLLDTLRANFDHCVGMAANMIGVKKNIIVVAAGPFQFAMINPVITGKSGAFQTEEGCLSLDGVRTCTRYKEIEVDYFDQNFKKKHGKYTGWTAQIIQHEVDHCNGGGHMKLKNILIVVDNIEESIHFYNELFGLNVISRQEGNVIMSEGLVLQDAGIWKESMQIQTIPYNNMMELYFEDNDIEGVVKKLESGRYEVRYATALTELDGGQKLVRFYDPSGNLIEVRTPWDKFVNRE